MPVKISVVVVNYNSPYQLSRCILPHMERMECVDEIVVVHGNPDTKFEYSGGHCRVVNLHINSNRLDQTGEGMLARFRGFQRARNDTVLSLDDDVVVPEPSLDGLCAQYEKIPEVIHSLFGRNPDQRLRYSHAPQFGEVTFALTPAGLFPRRIADDIFDWLGRNRDEWMIRNRLPERNGEDLLASLLCIKRTGRLNMAYPFHTMLINPRRAGAAVRISDAPRHQEDRTMITRHIVPLLQVGHLIKTVPADGLYRRARSWLDGPH